MRILKSVLLAIFLVGLCISPSYEMGVEPITNLTYVGGGDVWITNWIPSTSQTSTYCMGKFFYRISRSQYPVDKAGNYKFDIYFLSDSYYPQYYYDGGVYRSATKIDSMVLYVNGSPCVNNLTGSSTFWLLFQGNFDNGVGDIGISFFNRNPSPKIYMTWSQPNPF